jgi:hypothetical protein
VTLSKPFRDLIGPYLPVLTQTVPLPFGGKIIYDRLTSNLNISFGLGIRRGLNENHKWVKARHRHVIVERINGSEIAQIETGIT